jgi:DNA-binding response OmpR family regulator
MQLRALRTLRDDDGTRSESKRLVPVRRGPIVLLVEDDRDMREMLALVLRKDGFTVVEAEDGDDALEWLGLGALEGEPRRWPALIVSDVCLPYLSGLDLLEGLSSVTKRLPVVLITGVRDPATHERAIELGALCVLDKPFQLCDFRSVVRAALRQHSRAASALGDHVA